MKEDTRTTESLLARRALAEKATPGSWKTEQYDYYDIDGEFQKSFSISNSDKDTYVATVQDSSWMKENAAYIAANSPDVVMADIDEILRLREENERLTHILEIQRGMVQTAQQTAKLAWGGEIPSPLPGHKSMTEEEAAAMFEHLNCPWCGGSGHVGDCAEADQRVKVQLERLDKEADWLARICAEQALDEVDEESVNWWREKAKEAAKIMEKKNEF